MMEASSEASSEPPREKWKTTFIFLSLQYFPYLFNHHLLAWFHIRKDSLSYPQAGRSCWCWYDESKFHEGNCGCVERHDSVPRMPSSVIFCWSCLLSRLVLLSSSAPLQASRLSAYNIGSPNPKLVFVWWPSCSYVHVQSIHIHARNKINFDVSPHSRVFFLRLNARFIIRLLEGSFATRHLRKEQIWVSLRTPEYSPRVSSHIHSYKLVWNLTWRRTAA